MRAHTKADLYYQLSLLDPLVLAAYPKVALIYNPKDPQPIFKLSDKLINYAQLVDTYNYCARQGWLEIKTFAGLTNSSPGYINIYAPAGNVCKILPVLKLKSLKPYQRFSIDPQEKERKQILYFRSPNLTLISLFTAVFGTYTHVKDDPTAPIEFLIKGFTLETLQLQIDQQYKELVAIFGADLTALELIAQAN